MLSPSESFDAQIAAAEQRAAYDALYNDFAGFHSEHIAPHNAEVRVGALSLLAAAGSKIDGSLADEIYLRNTLSTGFLLAGEVQTDGKRQIAPVIKIDADLDTQSRRGRKLYNTLLDVSYMRDFPGTPSALAKLCVNQMTTKLAETPITVRCGTISNLPPDAPAVWNRFTQTKNRVLRPHKAQTFGNNTTVEGYFTRRLSGDVLMGWHTQNPTFKTSDPAKLYVPPTSTLPSMELSTSEIQAFENDRVTAEELFEIRRATASHNAAIATTLFREVRSRATTMANGKLGRWFWYGSTSWRQKLRHAPHRSQAELSYDSSPELGY